MLPPGPDGRSIERDATIPRHPFLREDVRALMAVLSRESGLLPAGVEVRHAFRDAFGILYVDVGAGLQQWASEAPAAAETAIQSVVATLIASLEGVKRVQFLVEAQEWRSTVGTLELKRPLALADEPPLPERADGSRMPGPPPR
jgi:hypothetical protein